MVLLNQHCKVHHDVAFYACQLHITSQYLGRICRKYDGRGPKEIIDEMLLLQLKSTLKNTEKSMKEISYEYNFSNFSFMCSFFRRNVGISPSEFRAKSVMEGRYKHLLVMAAVLTNRDVHNVRFIKNLKEEILNIFVSKIAIPL